MNTLRKVWALFIPAEQRKAVGMLLLVICMALAETLGVLSIMPFLSVLARPDIIQENRWLHALYSRLGFTEQLRFIIVLGLISMTAVVASSAFKTITLHLVNRFVYMLRHSLSTQLLARYLGQPYEFFLLRNPAELSKNVLSEADQFTFSLLQPLSMLLAQGAVVLAMVVLIVAYDPWMALAIVAVIAVLYGAIYLLVRRRLRRIGHERQQADIGRYKSCSEALGGIKDVKVTHTADSWLGSYAHHSRQLSRHMATAETLSASPLYIVEAVGYSGLILIALFLLIRSNDIAHVLPALGMYGFAAYRLLPAVQIMYRGFARLQYSAATLDAVHRDLTLPLQPAPASVGAIVPQQEIRLQGIHYAYPSTPDKPALDGIDLVIPANSSLGIAGQSGAGKSTLMDVLLGLLTPQAGCLTVDGIPITSANVADWQRSIGYVPQHIYLADASVAENIAFGIPKDHIDMLSVERAAQVAHIHDFIIRELPEGYATLVGDRGIRLSGGQRQRIGIARALYRDPPVIFMDEATSALDSKTEEIINNAIQEVSKNKTIVFIAHRNSTLKSAGKVIYLSE